MARIGPNKMEVWAEVAWVATMEGYAASMKGMEEMKVGEMRPLALVQETGTTGKMMMLIEKTAPVLEEGRVLGAEGVAAAAVAAVMAAVA